MLPVLFKVFVMRFYRANAGFFMFFFFIFFGAVEGSGLLRYHLSLMESMFGSATILSVVFVFWLLYHLKCLAFFYQVINCNDGQWLHAMQCLGRGRQRWVYATLYVSVYAPVFVYAVMATVVGFIKGYVLSATGIFGFQLLSAAAAVFAIHRRINNWLAKPVFRPSGSSVQKSFPFFLLFHFTAQKQKLLLALKTFSLLLFYLILVWNRGGYDHDSFLLVYLLVLFAHAAVPYLSVQFFEKQLAFGRNLPLSLFRRAVAFAVPYFILALPEGLYLFWQAGSFTFGQQLAYFLNLPVAMFLLTAISYSQGHGRNDYLSATSILLFVSVFALHAQVFWHWLAVQCVIAVTLFAAGFYGYEKPKE